MMERSIIRGLFFGMVLISSCYYDNEEELYPSTMCITENMSLQTNIVPILQNNCYSCHSIATAPANRNVILEGYDELIKYVNNGQLVGAIRHESDYPMPQNAPKLSSCNISKIESWIDAGALDN